MQGCRHRRHVMPVLSTILWHVLQVLCRSEVLQSDASPTRSDSNWLSTHSWFIVVRRRLYRSPVKIAQAFNIVRISLLYICDEHHDTSTEKHSCSFYACALPVVFCIVTSSHSVPNTYLDVPYSPAVIAVSSSVLYCIKPSFSRGWLRLLADIRGVVWNARVLVALPPRIKMPAATEVRESCLFCLKWSVGKWTRQLVLSHERTVACVSFFFSLQQRHLSLQCKLQR